MMFAESVTDLCWQDTWDVNEAAQVFARLMCERARDRRLVPVTGTAKTFGMKLRSLRSMCSRQAIYVKKKPVQYPDQTRLENHIDPNELAAYCKLNYAERIKWAQRRRNSVSYLEEKLRDYERGKDTVDDALRSDQQGDRISQAGAGVECGQAKGVQTAQDIQLGQGGGSGTQLCECVGE